MSSAAYIPWLPAIAAVLCGLCCLKRSLRRFAAPICIIAIAAAFILTLVAKASTSNVALDLKGAHVATDHVVEVFDWIKVGSFDAGFNYWVDPLTILMLMVVTGVGSLVAIYAAGYMKGDKGYARFFAYVSLFIFAMTTLVLADNLVLLYLGWEGVGLCSYLLIGYYYNKPSAVAAAKKAFIVNRIGDLGFALGIFLTYALFDTVRFSELLPKLHSMSSVVAAGGEVDIYVRLIPFLLMLGAFGKSAQLPLYVWLPDAMEGPTPVSALIHAATMVTAGVYMIVRLLPLFALSPAAMATIATVGGLTALFAATIALTQYDLKKVFAYSTISQLGYMFLGVGVMSAAGGVFHLFTHAFFKALLFLTAGSVMHACAGQLDLRKLSGLKAKMPVTCWLMFIGCLALAGFPLTAGFFSKDEILAAAIERGMHGEHALLFTTLGILGLVTALLTSFYTFRLWFRVFLGPVQYEMGEEHHAEEEGQGHGAKGHGTDAAHGAEKHDDIAHEHHHEPHEMPWTMNAPLVVLAIGAILTGYFGGWVEHSIEGATSGLAVHAAHATPGADAVAGAEAIPGAHATLLGMSLHTAMMLISSVISILGIVLAAWFHWLDRESAASIAAAWPRTMRVLRNKWYVDELYDAVIVRPLRGIGHVCYQVDRLIIDGLVSLVGIVPRWMGLSVQPVQRGALQGYGLGMVTGLAAIAAMVWIAIR